MPFYEYECANCKFYKEVMQKVSDAPLKKCPSCGKNALKKLLSAPVFRLKGAGWYETDFKSDKEQKRNLAEKEPEPEKKKEAANAKDVKSEVKPAEKAAEGKATEAKPAPAKPAAESKPASENASPRRSGRMFRKSSAKTSPKSKPKAKSARRKRR
jgi:putative FmdB family regulatory protein